ncbi:MAG TPA: hypothetical protein VK619_09535 [Pyrinomonadaceae bacterium]|nr:hypothetical protein [Pyrinomonadaceae bacterium]
MPTEQELTEQEKEHIRLEESYRREVRRQLEGRSKKSKRQSIWAFLNSAFFIAFFIWLLSSVVVNQISSRHTRNEQRIASENENRFKRKKIDDEISSRLSYVHTITYKKGVVQFDPLTEALTVLEKPAESRSPLTVIPEYSNRNIQSLLSELLELIPDDEKKRIQNAYDLSRTFARAYTVIKLNPQDVVAQKIQQGEVLDRCSFYALMVKNFNLDRWGKPFGPEPSDCF